MQWALDRCLMPFSKIKVVLWESECGGVIIKKKKKEKAQDVFCKE